VNPVNACHGQVYRHLLQADDGIHLLASTCPKSDDITETRSFSVPVIVALSATPLRTPTAHKGARSDETPAGSP